MGSVVAKKETGDFNDNTEAFFAENDPSLANLLTLKAVRALRSEAAPEREI
jgi:hypothetical protein